MRKDNNIIISMDSKGRATDNIAIERFWRSAKVERIYLQEYNSIKELKQDIKNYINFYNYYRFHQTLNYLVKQSAHEVMTLCEKTPMEVYDEKKYKSFISDSVNIKIFNKMLLKVA